MVLGLNNTKNELKITKRKKGKMIALMAGITASSMLISIINPKAVNAQTTNQEEYYGNDARDYYFSIYEKIYKELNMEEFDSKFIDLYNNGIILEDEKEYPLEEVRVKRNSTNNEIHFILLDDFQKDIITGNTIESIETGYWPAFRDTTIFYEMYKDGKFKENKITLDEEVLEYAKDWNGEIHTEIPRLKAEKETNEIYKKTYKR